MKTRYLNSNLPNPQTYKRVRVWTTRQNLILGPNTHFSTL